MGNLKERAVLQQSVQFRDSLTKTVRSLEMPLQLEQFFLVIGARSIIQIDHGLYFLEMSLRATIAGAEFPHDSIEERFALCSAGEFLMAFDQPSHLLDERC